VVKFWRVRDGRWWRDRTPADEEFSKQLPSMLIAWMTYKGVDIGPDPFGLVLDTCNVLVHLFSISVSDILLNSKNALSAPRK
jgi:hypothetical protein